MSGAPIEVAVLDRDGTIVIDRHYLGDPAGLEFLPGAVSGLRRLQVMGCRLVIITNQSGVGRGLITLEQVESVNDALTQLLKDAGIAVEGTYFCPHAPQAGCDCRKPNGALLRRAARELGFEPGRALVIGDKSSDIEFGRRAGARTLLISARDACCTHPEPDFLAPNLYAAADILERLLLHGSRAVPEQPL